MEYVYSHGILKYYISGFYCAFIVYDVLEQTFNTLFSSEPRYYSFSYRTYVVRHRFQCYTIYTLIFYIIIIIIYITLITCTYLCFSNNIYYGVYRLYTTDIRLTSLALLVINFFFFLVKYWLCRFTIYSKFRKHFC